MYLEISPRRSGKTFRLVNAYLAYKGNKAIVVPNHNAKRVYTRIYGIPKDEILVAVPNRELGYRNWYERANIHEQKLFYDEFDLIKHPECIIYSENNYYAGTPEYFRRVDDIISWKHGGRNDQLLELSKMYKEYMEKKMAGITTIYGDEEVTLMKDMEFGRMYKTVGGLSEGNIVVRYDYDLVMNLTDISKESYWDEASKSEQKVKILKSGESITLVQD